MDQHAFDALFIGAGIAGATAAAHLAASRRVAILAAEESPGYHATDRSAAIWIRNYGSPDARLLTAASRAFFAAPPPGFAAAALMRPRPVVHLAPPVQVATLGAMIGEGEGIREIDLEAQRAMVPALRPGHAAQAWYLRPEARRKLMVSPADETDSEACDAQPEEYDIALALDRMRQALDIPVTRVEHRWAGRRSFTPDRRLAIGAGAEKGFFWMVGQGGCGLQTAPAAGRLLAAPVAGEDPGERAPAAALCDPRRFARGLAA